jgi:hypothetical protein
MKAFIENADAVFNEIAREEGTETTMIEWIKDNLNSICVEEFVKGLSEKEKFLYAFGILNGIITERYGI